MTFPAELSLALPAAPDPRRLAVAALFALDRRLAELTRFTRDPMVAQMRLTWWYEAIRRLDTAPAPAEPLLQTVQRDLLPFVAGASLADMVEGWEELLDAEPLDEARLTRFATGRGERLFRALARILSAGERDPIAAAGQAWALLDVAEHSPDRAAAEYARRLAAAPLAAAIAVRWSRNGRPIGALVHLSCMPDRSPAARWLRVLRHRLTGR